MTYPLVFFRCTTRSSAELPHFWVILFYYGRAKQTAASTCTSHVLENRGAAQCTTSPCTPPSTPSSKWIERSFLFFLGVFEKAQQGSLSYILIRHLSIMIFLHHVDKICTLLRFYLGSLQFLSAFFFLKNLMVTKHCYPRRCVLFSANSLNLKGYVMIDWAWLICLSSEIHLFEVGAVGMPNTE